MIPTVMLRRKHIGEEVKLLQEKLINAGYSCGPCGADGEFGKDTEAAVIQFQTDKNLEIDGIVGSETWNALFGNLSTNKTPDVVQPAASTPAPSTTSASVSNVLDVARSQIGYHEKASNASLDDNYANSGSGNWTKYARDLDSVGWFNGAKNGYAWCAVFVAWCFYKAYGKEKGGELLCQPLGRNNCAAVCTYGANYFKQNNQFYTSPQPGDQIFFGNASESYHTGIVESVSGNQVTTIEGNSSDGVARRTYPLSYGSIYGYGRPKYQNTNVTMSVSGDEPKELSIGAIVTANVLNIRQAASSNSAIIGTLQKGQSVTITEINGSWGKINQGWISMDYVKEQTL